MSHEHFVVAIYERPYSIKYRAAECTEQPLCRRCPSRKSRFYGMLFEGEYRFTKKMVAEFYEVDLSTINRYIAQYEDELKYNGYFLCRGKLLKELKLQFGHVINEMTKATRLGLFNFRAVLNMGMLLTESEKAKQVRTRILDIVIATINKRAGGGTKYINTRDIDFLPAAIEEDNYRKNFTTAVGKHKNI